LNSWGANLDSCDGKLEQLGGKLGHLGSKLGQLGANLDSGEQLNLDSWDGKLGQLGKTSNLDSLGGGTNLDSGEQTWTHPCHQPVSAPAYTFYISVTEAPHTYLNCKGVIGVL
jgi:hypothetical protein